MSSHLQDQPASPERPRADLPQTTVDELHEIAARYPQARSALLPMLHLVQSVEGCVTPAGIETCADILGLTAAEVAAVSTFYTMYKRRPAGTYHVGVCTNTLCAIMGGDLIFERLKEHLDIGNDETSEDGQITLEHVECNAACDYAPVMMVNWEFMDTMTPESAVDLVDRLRAGEQVTSTRGPRICTWREAERVLAGFPDDRADEGPGAGPASLVGLEIARERGWKAPDGGDRESDLAGAEAAGKPASKQAAASGADSGRAETETEVEESPADVKGEGGSSDGKKA
ncbi:MAG TPA: NADH-quinone oxidoreductase subunit NuoE [Nocardioidaceae bacterium]|nr:NADH-quinone oxidoreductase subunit NuoE [Nocardioidaceae bacterium]